MSGARDVMKLSLAVAATLATLALAGTASASPELRYLRFQNAYTPTRLTSEFTANGILARCTFQGAYLVVCTGYESAGLFVIYLRKVGPRRGLLTMYETLVGGGRTTRHGFRTFGWIL